jgi:hypothetical protein
MNLVFFTAVIKFTCKKKATFIEGKISKGCFRDDTEPSPEYDLHNTRDNICR